MQGLKDVTQLKTKRALVPRKISPTVSRKLGCLIYQNPMVTREELQEDLHSSCCGVIKQTITNEMLRNGLKSRRPKETLLRLKQHRDARLKFVKHHEERKIRFGKENYGGMKLKLSWRKNSEAY